MNRAKEMLSTAARCRAVLHAADARDVVEYVRSRRHVDGGFRGRSPAADPYYTVFGVSCLLALNQPPEPESIGRFLETYGDGSGLDLVHLASLVRCRAMLPDAGDPESLGRLLGRMEGYRAADGGYNLLGPGHARGCVYGSFLAFLAYDEAGAELPRQECLLNSLPSMRTPDGGYANAAGLRDATTSVTAAAILLQRWIAGAADAEAARALLRCERNDGGFAAFPGAPEPDLLSTSTALYALRATGEQPGDADAHLEFVEMLWEEDGGFCACPAAPVTDCEYTFYALLAMGSLHDG